MSGNPLQKYFRQPKVFIKLPSGGIFTKPGIIQGDINHLPVYGMTGMDEIIVKTPDALLSGESTVAVVKSCCPSISDPWELCVLDLIIIQAAIRIATYGNSLSVDHKCPNCGSDNSYDLDLNRVIEHYMNAKYDSKIVLDNLTINMQPMNYRQSTDFNIKNFKIQQRIAQANALTDEDAQKALTTQLFNELAEIQREIYNYTIESVDIGNQVVTERQFITEWLNNADKSVFDSIRKQNQKNNAAWEMPKFPVKCDSCGHETKISVELDQSDFFAVA